jgi:hypothetical protein
MRLSRRTFGSAGWLAVMLLASPGCSSSSSRPTCYEVRGHVFYRKTEPAAGALVVFHPVSEAIGARPFAHVAVDGTFELTTYDQGDGAPEGDYNVIVVWHESAKETEHQIREGARGNDRLNGRFADPHHPLLKATVTRGPNEFRFEIE